MRLKSFHAKTMSEAMKLVRQTLGDDAIIVATREEEGGGVRVTAAVEEEDQFTAAQARFAKAAKPAEPEVDVGEVVAETLHRHGVPTMLADQLVDLAAGVDTSDPVLALGSALDTTFTFHPFEEKRAAGPRVIVLVGPPGAGKTLAVAKLAARAVLTQRSVGVISTDTVRAGGLDQLTAFTRILKIKLASVEDPESLAGAIDVHGKADVVLVDTAGRNPFDPADISDLKSFLDGCKAEPVLVLPAGLDAFEAMDIAGVFKGLGVRRVMATRLDATRRYGSLLVTLHRARLSFCDGCHSPKVAEGLSPLKPVTLARMMMPEQEQPPVTKPARAATAKLTKSSSRTLP